MISKKIIGALTVLSLSGVIGGGAAITANAQPVHNLPIKTESHSTANVSNGDVQIHFTKPTTMKTLTKQETQELLKNNKNIPSFSSKQQAEQYFNNMKKEIIQNTKNHNIKNTGNEFYYTGIDTTSESLGMGDIYATLNVPYGVSYNGTLGNYYSSDNGGRANVGFGGFTWGESMSNGYGSATIGNNQHTIYAQGGGDINSYILIKGIGQFASNPFTISGQWTVPGAL